MVIQMARNKRKSKVDQEKSLENSYSRFWSYLFMGSLIMLTAEVFAGSSLLWYLDIFALLVTLPLYLSHMLLYYNLAKRSGKTSIWHMYLWGMLLALYEAPITKVLWIGYNSDTPPILGKIGGIAVFEFITLVFFYHPIFSFIFPLSVFQLLFSGRGRVLPPYWQKFERLGTVTQIFVMFFIISLSSLSMVSSGFAIPVQFLATTGSILILSIIYKYKGSQISEEALVLGNKGMKVLAGYIVLLYTFTFFTLRPEGIPVSILPYLIIIVFAIFVLLLIFRYVKDSKDVLQDLEVVNLRPLAVLATFFVGVGILFGALPPVTIFVMVIDIILFPVLGILLFIRLILTNR